LKIEIKKKFQKGKLVEISIYFAINFGKE